MLSVISPPSRSIAKYRFPSGHTAEAMQLSETVDQLGGQGLQKAMAQMGLPCSQHPVLVVVGGAKGGEKELERLLFLFEEVLAPIAQKTEAIVVDGGTDAGVMRLIGQARSSIQGTFPLVGVCPKDLVNLKGLYPKADSFSGARNPDLVDLEPHHTHFFLVPGSDWGDESKYLASIATAIAGRQPSVSVLVNGGNISLVDAKQSILEKRTLAVLANTGRLADEIAGEKSVELMDPEKRKTVRFIQKSKKYVHLLDVKDLAQLKDFLWQRLSVGELKSPNCTKPEAALII